ncbi:MAG: hypothetical protein NDF54_05945 [archaeon GB-1867-035]|nr:hypothetical protein [Candidatus Culexmicrobium profundum]
MSLYDLTRHPRFPEFLANMLLTLNQFYALDEEMKIIILRSFESWLKRVGESASATTIVKCPHCGKPIEVRLTVRSAI